MKKPDAKGKQEGVAPVKPFKPQRGWFWGLLIGFVVWVGVLLGLYFKTVYPERHPSTGAAATRPGASGLPSAPR